MMPLFNRLSKYMVIFGLLLVVLISLYQYTSLTTEGQDHSSSIHLAPTDLATTGTNTLKPTKRSTTTKTGGTTKTFEKDKFKKLLHQFIKTQKAKTILTYTKVFGDIYWWDVPVNFKFHERDGTPCEFSHCNVVYTRSAVKYADAVLFHAAELPPVKDLAKLRNSHEQTWIWMTSESPLHYRNENKTFEGYENFFNWTGTYRSDSRIWTPFHFILPLQPSDHRPVANYNYADGKNKMIIAIISNHCQSYRIEFIKKLKKYINIDLFGSCKSEVDPQLPDCAFGSRECLALQSEYKFTLSLENAFCTDYVTEKFYLNGLIRGNVPIVMNRGNFSNHNVAPPNSYINILDFENVENLAKHLKDVASSDKKYNKYHSWRQQYKVTTKNRMCTTCEELWKKDISKTFGKAGDEKMTQKINPNKFWDFRSNCVSFDDKLLKKYIT